MEKYTDEQLIRKYKNELEKYNQLSKMKAVPVMSEQPRMPVTTPQQAPIEMPIGEKTTFTNPLIARNESTVSETGSTNQTVEEMYRAYVQEHPKIGQLQVQTLTARGTFPVPGATVEIFKAFPVGNYFIGKFETDNAGLTPKISVPTAEAILSLSPGVKQPYATFDAIITHPKFTEVRVHNIAVFENIVALQIVNMVPKSAVPDGRQYIEYSPSQYEDI